MEKTITVVEALEHISTARPIQEVRVIRRMGIGQVVRQGDIYVHRVRGDHPRGAARKGAEARQLAVGQTQGARHRAEDPAVVYEGTTPPTTCRPRTFLGPLIVSTGRFLISHPEHAHCDLPAGTYQITHQMDAQTLQRVRD